MQNANTKFHRNAYRNLVHEMCRNSDRHSFLYNALYVEEDMIIYRPVYVLLLLSSSKHFPTLKSFFKLIYYTDSRYKVYKDKLQNCSCNQFHCIGTCNQVETNSMTIMEVEIKAVKNE